VISADHVRLMARYNQWQNTSIYKAADSLSDEARRAARGAFFGSIHGTLSHLMWGDKIWMHRFESWPKPEGGIADSASLFSDWAELKAERVRMDAAILAWTQDVSESWLAESLSWFSGALGREISRDRWHLVAHMFNHQTHHRGQVHAMLTAAGAKPEDTDLMIVELAG
jgi:uncharacterized damage-inducible protein DinB